MTGYELSLDPAQISIGPLQYWDVALVTCDAGSQHFSENQVSAVAFGAVMKESICRRLGTFFLIAFFTCALSAAQTTTPGQANRSGASTAPTSSSDQTSAPLRSTPPNDTFIIGSDDVLAISVWKEADLTKQIPVRSDGKISLPLIGDTQAAGRTPAQLETDIATKLRSYITDPQVSVIVQEIKSLKFNILGQVNKPGSYSLTTGTTVVDAIALGGGFRDFAKKKGLYVLRHGANGVDARYPFNYQDFIKGKDPERNILLKPHDTVVVP